MELNQVFLTAGLAIISGAISSLVAPWAKWGIEKRKLQYEYRKQILIKLKSMLLVEKFDRVRLINTSEYMQVRNYFSKETVERLERPLNHLLASIGSPAFDLEKKNILEEISRLERKWKLI